VDLGVRQLVGRGRSVQLGSRGCPLRVGFVDHIDQSGWVNARPDRLLKPPKPRLRVGEPLLGLWVPRTMSPALTWAFA
jgi:hypothetical protein